MNMKPNALLALSSLAALSMGGGMAVREFPRPQKGSIPGSRDGTTPLGKERIIIYKLRAERKQLIRACGCLAGLVAKHNLILNKKGKNGRSMSPELFARHADAADQILALA